MNKEPSEKEPSEKEPKKRRRWVIPTVTTIAGAVVSLLIAWYQIDLSKEQALQAEKERAKSVKNELVLIVEEHVINQKPLDIYRLARLAKFRAKQESLLIIPTVSEIVENAEFNILKSQYLEFEKKQQIKEIFNGIYSDLSIPESIKYSGAFENTVNDIYVTIQKGNTKDLPAKVNKLVTDFNTKIAELEAKIKMHKKTGINELIKAAFDKPVTMIFAFSMYLFLLFLILFITKQIRTYRELQKLKFELKPPKIKQADIEQALREIRNIYVKTEKN